MKKRRKRISYELSKLKNELKKRAVAEKEDKEKRDDYWRLYFNAKNAEGEVRELVMEAEIRRLVEFLAADGRYGDLPLDDDSTDNQQSPPGNDKLDDNDIPPHQKGLWD